MDPYRLEDLRRRVRQRLDELKRQEALHPPSQPYVNPEEVAAISRWLNAAAEDPGEWK